MMKLPEGSPIWNMVKNHDKNNNSMFFKTVLKTLKLFSFNCKLCLWRHYQTPENICWIWTRFSGWLLSGVFITSISRFLETFNKNLKFASNTSRFTFDACWLFACFYISVFYFIAFYFISFPFFWGLQIWRVFQENLRKINVLISMSISTFLLWFYKYFFSRTVLHGATRY